MDHNSDIPYLRIVAEQAQDEYDREIDEAVDDLLAKLPVERNDEDIIVTNRTELAELITSNRMLEALGFNKHWEWGHFPDGIHDADNEEQAHSKAARKPEIEGGYVRHVWTRASVEVPYNQDIADGARARRTALAEASAARAQAIADAEALYQQRIAYLKD